MARKILIINGGLTGARGNTAIVLNRLARSFESERIEARALHLADEPRLGEVLDSLRWAQGFVFATGTYWDSWSSHLQRFLEEVTELEGNELWLGKPAGVIVTMHSVGGKAVLSRLQGVLSTLGLMIPPMSGMVYSLVGQQALNAGVSDWNADLWQLDDLGVLSHNLLEALETQGRWHTWPVDEKDPRRIWCRP